MDVKFCSDTSYCWWISLSPVSDTNLVYNRDECIG